MGTNCITSQSFAWITETDFKKERILNQDFCNYGIYMTSLAS